MAPSAIAQDSYSYDYLQRFSSIYQTADKSTNRLPAALKGWPTHLNSPLAWDNVDLNNEEAYTYVLTEEDKHEINNALSIFKDLKLKSEEVNQSNFPLPKLRRQLRRLAIELHQKKGFFIVRGLAVEDYSAEDNAIVFLGISCYIGEKRGQQDYAGNMLMHIRNATEMPVRQEDRPARDSTLGLTFHTDLFCDILALQTRGCAASGGEHLIASTYTIYNELIATRPDLLDILAKPLWTFDPRSPHAQPTKRACIFYHGGRIILNFGRNRLLYLENLDRDKPSSLTVEQLEALEVLQLIAERHQLKLAIQPGDLAYINNFGILHSREAFEDSDEATRYLVRLWIKNEELAWKLPPTLQSGNHSTYYDIPEEVWSIVAAPRLDFDFRDRFGP